MLTLVHVFSIVVISCITKLESVALICIGCVVCERAVQGPQVAATGVSFLTVQAKHLFCHAVRFDDRLKNSLDIELTNVCFSPTLELFCVLFKVIFVVMQLVTKGGQVKAAGILTAHLVMLANDDAVGAEKVDSTKEHKVGTRTIHTVQGNKPPCNFTGMLGCCDISRYIGQVDIHLCPCIVAA